MKTRSKPSSLASAKPVTISDVLAWAIPARHTAAKDVAIPPREPRLYTLTAYVRKIGLSEDDCDFHLELAASGDAGAPRVIAEIPAVQRALQRTVAGIFNLSDSAIRHNYNGPKAKRITVTGYAFLDLTHQCPKFPKAGCEHGGDRVQTLWEIHPVFDAQWADSRASAFNPSDTVTLAVSPRGDTRQMSDDALLWNTPKPPPRAAQPGERLWSMTKTGKRVDAELRIHTGVGVECQFLVDGELAEGRLWANRTDALAAADAKRRELERRGWIAVQNKP
jgi:hypothetical protein